MGFFPVTGESFSRGKSYYIAADMALRDVNARADVLGGYRLTLDWRDTQCTAGLGTKSLFTFINSTRTYIMLLGTGCSVVAEPVSMAADLWNIVQMSYAASNPALSDRNKYKSFYRTCASDTIFNYARLAMIKLFKWTRVATIHENQELFSTSINRFGSLLTEENVTLITSESFAIDPAEQIRNLKEKGAWIIFGNFYENMARRVFCEVYKEGLYGRNYAWFLLGWYKPRWWEEPDHAIDCTPEQLYQAVEGYFSTEDLPLSIDTDQVTISGLTPNEFEESYMTYSAQEGSDDINDLASYAYDAIWSIALVLNESIQFLQKESPHIKLSDFTYSSTDMRNVFMTTMESIEFDGISGPVSFTSSGDREGLIGLRQMQGGENVAIGRFEPQSGKLTLEGYAPIIWKGDGPPKDSTLNVYSPKHISLTFHYIFGALSCCGLVMVAVFAGFVAYYWKRELIQKSTPVFQFLFLLGCTFIYITIVTLSIDRGHVDDDDTLATWCTIRAWVFVIGFSCAYGVLFSKIYRAHSVYTSKLNPWIPGSHCGHMIKTVLFCLAFDVIVLIIWMVQFPLEVVIEETDSYLDTQTNTRTISEVAFCAKGTSSYFVAIFYVFNGLLLLLGAFLSYETRHLKIRNLNDTFMNGISIYIILTLSIVCAPLSFILEQEPELAYVIIASLTWLATTATILVIFVPKVLSLRGTFNIRFLIQTKSDEEVFEEEADTETKLRYRIADVDMAIEKVRKQISRNIEFKKYATTPGACSVWCCGHHVGCTLIPTCGRHTGTEIVTAGHDSIGQANDAYVYDEHSSNVQQRVTLNGKMNGCVHHVQNEGLASISAVETTTTSVSFCETEHDIGKIINERNNTTRL
ncbi:gamma-aminobutyric acid type B receptor subunit 1-like [Antedon mediterranea]|uniref:gamma-aminobutyric acid type B receptor subunit 1-like n=1 Tax=Antedon mediterranea TaxID=105859 RepID=UPI003AF7E804